MDGAGHDSDVLAIRVGADVDDQGAAPCCRQRLGRREPLEPGSGVVKQLVECATHGRMISVGFAGAPPS